MTGCWDLFSINWSTYNRKLEQYIQVQNNPPITFQEYDTLELPCNCTQNSYC